MKSISERARELAIDVEDKCCRGDYVYVGSEAAHLIEQALLAERRLAMEEAATMLEEYGATMQGNSANHSLGAAFNRIFQERADLLRAAAEKEVGK